MLLSHRCMKPAPKRNLQLDVLRGLAILLVFGRHLEIPRPDGMLGIFAELWFRIGWIGVDLFFVLSGFLIGGLLVTEFQQHGKINVMRFLVRRGLKIYPAYIVFIAYLVLTPTLKALVSGGAVWDTFVERWRLCWPNLLFLQNYLWTAAGHTWTLAVEEHFYLLLPFALVALAASKRMRLIMPLSVAVVPIFLSLRCLSVWTEDPFSTTMSATHLRLDALFLGVGIRGLAQYSPARFAALRRWRVGLIAAGILLWAPNLFSDLSPLVVRTVGLSGTLLGAGAFLVATYHTHASDFGRWSRFVARPAQLVAWIGLYSYTIYLWHVTTMGIVERVIGGRILAGSDVSNPAAWAACAGMACTGAILAGVVASKVVEQPVLHLRDRIFPSRTGHPSAGEVGRPPSCTRVTESKAERPAFTPLTPAASQPDAGSLPANLPKGVAPGE